MNLNKQVQINNKSSEKIIKTNQNKISEILNNFVDEYYTSKLSGKKILSSYFLNSLYRKTMKKNDKEFL